MSAIKEIIGRVLKVRSMVAADLPRLLQIEKQPNGSRLLRHALPANRPSGDRGIWVATVQNSVVGYLIYQVYAECDPGVPRQRIDFSRTGHLVETQSFQPPRVHILHLFVAPNWRRQGIGRALTQRFEPKPFLQDDCRIQSAVPETDLAMQLLLRSAGYKAIQVLRGHFVNEDAYLMERCHY